MANVWLLYLEVTTIVLAFSMTLGFLLSTWLAISLNFIAYCDLATSAAFYLPKVTTSLYAA